ncbi:hypothetical protein KY290_030135 [Solanum tuberosum]|uniref:AIPP2-like SPOC-like domain-containing protein n=1 Tax=Solanum tuberosum TaxID=4113 RepID=A0ABQ7UMR5_SOLTU|nr:hypothetical protein KY290_030135 [Solanum tuberosum]
MNSSMSYPCDPSLVPSRKGGFDILGALEILPGMLNSCIQAHPPSRVRRKVYEFSGLVPDTLKFELVPRGGIWESLCNNHTPSKEDIGLYFFASEKKRSERYIALVKFMRSKDLVMRMLINDVELFILASTALCSDSQKKNCEICGDTGFEKAILHVISVTMLTCIDNSLSLLLSLSFLSMKRYCMLGYYVDAPMDWCCEECDIGKGIMSSSSGLEMCIMRDPSYIPVKRFVRVLCNQRNIVSFLMDIVLTGKRRKAIDVTLAAIAVGTANCGGLAKLSIQGNNLYRGVTDVVLKAIAQVCPTLKKLSLLNVSSVGDEGLSEIAHGCHLLEKLDLFQCPRIINKSLLGIAKNCLNLNSLSMNDCSYIENESLKIMGQYCLNLKLVGLKMSLSRQCYH